MGLCDEALIERVRGKGDIALGFSFPDGWFEFLFPKTHQISLRNSHITSKHHIIITNT